MEPDICLRNGKCFIAAPQVTPESGTFHRPSQDGNQPAAAAPDWLIDVLKSVRAGETAEEVAARYIWMAMRQLERESARRRQRIEGLRGLCKTAVGMLRDADAVKDASAIARLIGDMEPKP